MFCCLLQPTTLKHTQSLTLFFFLFKLCFFLFCFAGWSSNFVYIAARWLALAVGNWMNQIFFHSKKLEDENFRAWFKWLLAARVHWFFFSFLLFCYPKISLLRQLHSIFEKKKTTNKQKTEKNLYLQNLSIAFAFKTVLIFFNLNNF